MKPFDLEAALAGAPLITRDGATVKFIAYVPEAHEGQRVVVLDSEGMISVHFENGNYYHAAAAGNDLFMAPKKRTVWVNFFKYGECHYYGDKDTADIYMSGRLGDSYPVEIEE